MYCYKSCDINIYQSKAFNKIRNRLNALPEDEKEVLINLFIRLEVDEIEFERQINKNKNTKVKIKLSDVEISLKEQRFIKVNVKINEQ